MDVLGKLKAQQQEKTETIREAKEAAEAKANEYAALSAKVDRLEKSIESLETAIEGLSGTMQGITPQKIDDVQQAGTRLFDPLKQTAAELNEEIKAAGNQATEAVKGAAGEAAEAVRAAKDEIREANFSSIDIKGRAIYALLTALFFCAIQYGIQYHFSPDVDYARRMLWNLQMHNVNNDLKVDFFDDEKEVEKIIENERKYKATQELKAKQEQQNQK